MPWYDDSKRLTHVATYDNEKALRRDAERAAKKGWVLQGQTGHSTTEGGVVGAFGVVLGNFRTQNTITVTYGRDPRWFAAKSADTLARSLKAGSSRAEVANKTLTDRERKLRNAAREAAADPLGLDAQRNLLAITKSLVDARNQAQRRQGELSALMGPAVASHDAAHATGAKVSPGAVDREKASALLTQRGDQPSTQAMQEFQSIQNVLVRALESHSLAEAQRRQAAERSANAKARLAEMTRASEVDPDAEAPPVSEQTRRGLLSRLRSITAPPSPQVRLHKAREKTEKMALTVQEAESQVDRTRRAAEQASFVSRDAIDRLGIRK